MLYCPLPPALLLCALSSPSLASYYPPPVPHDIPTPQYEFNFARINGLAPLFGMDSESRIKDHYIVSFDHDDYIYPYSYLLDNHWAHLGQDLSLSHGFLKLRYGYGAHVPDAELLERIRADANVSFVEVNQLIEPTGLPGYE